MLAGFAIQVSESSTVGKFKFKHIQFLMLFDSDA